MQICFIKEPRSSPRREMWIKIQWREMWKIHHLLLQSHYKANFNQSWHKASLVCGEWTPKSFFKEKWHKFTCDANTLTTFRIISSRITGPNGFRFVQMKWKSLVLKVTWELQSNSQDSTRRLWVKLVRVIPPSSHSSAQPKAQVSFSDRKLCVVRRCWRRKPLTFSSFPEPTKLDTKHPCWWSYSLFKWRATSYSNWRW